MPGRSIVLALLLVALAAGLAHATAVTFRYRATGAPSSVHLAGTFNQWDTGATPMESIDEAWEVTIDLPPGKHQYKFVVDGSDWITDEWAVEFSDDGFGGQNSVVIVGEEPTTAGYGSRAIGPDGEAIEVVDDRTLVTFHFAPGARHVNAVSVAGDFNDFDAGAHVLRDADGDGVWSITLRLDPGSYAYQFVLDGDEWIDAGEGTGTEADGFGARRARIEVGTSELVVGP